MNTLFKGAASTTACIGRAAFGTQCPELPFEERGEPPPLQQSSVSPYTAVCLSVCLSDGSSVDAGIQ